MVDELWSKKRFKMAAVAILNFNNLNFWSLKSDDFSLRYGDLTIFKMAAIRHLGF